jgi:3,4-dihydroxy 2-butanone 4-phosphate synthase/GTP cyclohydrolase II
MQTIPLTPRSRRNARSEVEFIAVADLPTIYSEHPFRAHSFRSRNDGTEHLALVSPGVTTGVPLVRVHSECLTGDAFGSLRCDCGPQLQESLRKLAESAGGILIYLRGQEGRGIGLANKMRAYALQDGGMDTAEANHALGLPEDAREYVEAAEILRALGVARVRLLTNNPDKVAALRQNGIEVTRVEPLVIAANPFNARYLDTKARKFGHALPMSGTPRSDV